ncbi:MAG: PilZ domain-containing protein [Alphaproteobacteria bacterium]|nr:MAG: PilZ domain-containing protein [Alphaproteobacteria bacterium]
MFVEDCVVETGFSFSHAVPPPPERRQNERHLKILRVGTLIVDGRRELCLIRNISAGGVMAHVYSRLQPGAPVSVELKTSQPVAGRVIWFRDSNAGIKFDVPIEISELLANPPVLENGWRPRTPRVEIDCLATLRAGYRTYWVQARDVSQGGIKVETDEPPEPDTPVVLDLEGLGAVSGVVRWSQGTSCGIAFNQLVPFGELIAWLKTLK